jgi:hypothetical protein
MKNRFSLFQIATNSTLVVLLGSSMSCMTTYDGYGRPVQTVDPGLAIAGVAVAGLIGYAAANSHSSDHSSYRPSRNYYQTTTTHYSGGGYGGGYDGGYGGHEHCYQPSYDY